MFEHLHEWGFDHTRGPLHGRLTSWSGVRHPAMAAGCRISETPSHVIVALVVQHIAHEQHDGLAARVLPPVRGGIGLRPDLAGLVHNRYRTGAGVFDDLAFRDVDDGGTVAMAVPGHDAARFDGQLAEAELPVLDRGRLLLEIDGGERRVGDTLGGMGCRLASIGFDLVGRALAGTCRRKTEGHHDASKNSSPADGAAAHDAIEHDSLSSVDGSAGLEAAPARRISRRAS